MTFFFFLIIQSFKEDYFFWCVMCIFYHFQLQWNIFLHLLSLLLSVPMPSHVSNCCLIALGLSITRTWLTQFRMMEVPGWWEGKTILCSSVTLFFFFFLPALSWFSAFLYPSFHFWLLFAFPLDSLLFVLFCTCLPCRRTFGVWGDEEACYQSKYLVFFHSLPSFTLPAPLLTAVKLPSVKLSLLALMVRSALRAVIFPSLMGLCIRQSFLYCVVF